MKGVLHGSESRYARVTPNVVLKTYIVKLSPLPPDESHQPPENRNAATPHATTMNLLPTPNIRAGSPGDLVCLSFEDNMNVLDLNVFSLVSRIYHQE